MDLTFMSSLPRFWILCLDVLLLLGMARLIIYLFKRKEEEEVAVAGAGKRKTHVNIRLSALKRP